MSTLHARGLGAAHGHRTLFSGLDLVVAPGEVIGLVGANGAGKSTLLRLLAGLEPPAEGSVTRTPTTASVGYLPQEPQAREGETVAGFLARRTGVAAASDRLAAATEALALGRPLEGVAADDAYAEAWERWLGLGGADLDERVAETLEPLGLGALVDAPMTSLSGGQAARAGLASLLLSRYDVLLLDEPTNDLDLDGLERLEAFVTGLRVGCVLVSHDREFLARTVDKVVELDLAQQLVRVVGGGYEAFVEEREVARRHARESYEAYADTRSQLEERARTQRAWMEKGVRNARRKASDPDKFVKNFRAESSEKQAAKARQTERLIERLDVVEEPRKEWQLRLTIAAATSSGVMVARLREATVQRGDFRLGPVTLDVERGDRLAVTGPNGSGKTTLLGLMLGRLTPTSGSADLGPSVLVGEIDQVRDRFRGSDTLFRAFGTEMPDWTDAEVRTLLAKFGLGSDHVFRPAATLSPGERTRAGLALLQARGVNLLVLDEPTNHLDVPAIEQLEEALEDYPGTVIVVSHDRRLLSGLRVDRRLEVRDGVVREAP